MSEIHCLIKQGLPLTNEDRSLLYHVAHWMVKRSKTKHKVKSEAIRCKIMTRNEFTGLGSIYGQKFSAEIESEHGTQVVEYIIDTRRELSDMNWQQIPDMVAEMLLNMHNN